jgi:hypothetical protein
LHEALKVLQFRKERFLKVTSLENTQGEQLPTEDESKQGSVSSQSGEGSLASFEKDDKPVGEMEQKFDDLLRVVKEETLQLSEFLIEEKRLVQELCLLLKLTLRQLNASFHLSPKMISIPEKVNHVILNEEGHLILIDEKGGVNSKALEDYSPEIILNVLWVVLPELSEIIVGYRKRISFRVNVFEKISREFRNLNKMFTRTREEQAIEGSETTAEDEETPKDGVRKSLLSKK